MNIISARRAKIAIDGKIRQLESYRNKAKDKVLWDRKNRVRLVTARKLSGRLAQKILQALEDQGQFSHSPTGGYPEAEKSE